MIKVTNLNLTRNGRKILKAINFELNSNNHLAIIGPNGAGKSFLTRILSADLIPSYGSYIEVDSKIFGKTNLSELRKKIGFVSSKQVDWFIDSVSNIKQHILASDFDYTKSNLEILKTDKAFGSGVNSILEVVCTGYFGGYGISSELTKDMIKKAKKILLDFGFELQNKHCQIPFEILSDGEKRKVLLARALVTEPKVLVLDEPCQGLDIPSRENFLTEINKLSNQVLVIYVTHHLEDLPSLIKKILLIKNGKVFQFGDKEKTLTSKNLSKLFDYKIEVKNSGSRYFVNF